MVHVQIRFYEELNDFLPEEKRKKTYRLKASENQGIRDLIESENVPHTEVDMILVNSRAVNFAYRIKDGDMISVYPVFELLDISAVSHLRPEPLRNPSFILDVHLGKLARYMRIAGFDCLYSNCYEDSEISAIAHREKRTVLTRDRGLLKRSLVERGYWIRSQLPMQQLNEVIEHFSLKEKLNPLSICPACNGKLVKTDRESVIDRLPEKTALYYREFSQCPSCGRIYWKGSHFRVLEKMIQKL